LRDTIDAAILAAKQAELLLRIPAKRINVRGLQRPMLLRDNGTTVPK
jgi:hypothetical protein